ncbi:D-2-hydroxyacid dehydrogenase [Epilithonimonas arachidiradicis]|uniref:3-phosphoglycerate dehydrogenase n=1 Tax=Epilithonimonas arachidiradicis TaxID=1617282 RepID=A0A420CXH9_9FLAO|nr:D-2-hydroxyacid dehydrogenase [Epilithonimonas arachidiradicis]RKE83140.1 D-3-phosphoglycerate dehydrogenase [Epilithonimonas arachidiradicis]GGG65255.1 3-phosphoglycerate dehydrogenase [Epilithonimonas arachidiradicis]
MIVLANDGISEKGIQLLKEADITVLEARVSPEHLSKFINDNQVDVLLVRSATQVRKELIDSCPNLKIIGRGGIGMDNIDVEYAIDKGIYIINTPKASCKSVAELVFAHFFSLARFLHESNRLMPLEGETNFNALKKSFNNATELSGKTLGVIGMGNIGIEVIKMGISLGMKILAYNRTPKTENVQLSFFDGQSLDFEIKSVNLDEVLKNSDFISLNTGKTDEYLIDYKELELMKEGVFIANTARGGVINEVALLDAIESGKVYGAALDVFEKEPAPEVLILMNPALSLSPHVGGNTMDAQNRIGEELAQQIIKIKAQL